MVLVPLHSSAYCCVPYIIEFGCVFGEALPHPPYLKPLRLESGSSALAQVDDLVVFMYRFGLFSVLVPLHFSNIHFILFVCFSGILRRILVHVSLVFLLCLVLVPLGY